VMAILMPWKLLPSTSLQVVHLLDLVIRKSIYIWIGL
jgi:hypothetical protein